MQGVYEVNVYCVMCIESDYSHCLVKIFSTKVKAEAYIEVAKKHANGELYVDVQEVE